MNKEAVIEKVKSKEIVCSVVGLGYVGLPLAVEMAKAGFKTVGLDISESRVCKINAGENYIEDVSNEALKDIVSQGNLEATTDFSQLKNIDFVVICVPTPLDEHQEPDASYVISAAESVAEYLHKGNVVVLESTTYPGTTESDIKPLMEKKSGLVCGEDFWLGFSPERVDPGNLSYNTGNTPKIIGAIGLEATEAIGEIYRAFLTGKVVTVSSPAVAEMAKLLENTYRNINVGLINEFGRLCNKMNISVWEVIEAAKTKPYGFEPFYPGPGLGGHCIPIDPYYLTWKAREFGFHTTLIENSMVINDSQPDYCVERSMHIRNRSKIAINGAKLLLLGVAYKKDIGDCRESPSIEIMRLLKMVGAEVDYYDPWVPKFEGVRGMSEKSIESLTPEVLVGYDLVMVTTDHSNIDYDLVQKYAKVVFDTRNAMRHVKIRDKIEVL